MSKKDEAIDDAIASALCKSGRFETGEGTCGFICMDQLGSARRRPCSHRKSVFLTLVRDIREAMEATQ